MPRLTLGEISRLAVHTDFRRRLGESASPVGSSQTIISAASTEEERRTFPLISVSLVAASTALMALAHRPNLFIMVETWLARLLRQLGLNFIQVGETVFYHGQRAAYFITLEQMLSGMKGELRDMYGLVYDSLAIDALQANLDLIHQTPAVD